MAESKTPKIEHLMQVIREHVEDGRYLDTRHVLDRQSERKIFRPEILYVLRHGYHEKRQDRYAKEFQAWNYSVRGKTIDKRDLRVIVSFEKSQLVMITAIDLDA